MQRGFKEKPYDISAKITVECNGKKEEVEGFLFYSNIADTNLSQDKEGDLHQVATFSVISAGRTFIITEET